MMKEKSDFWKKVDEMVSTPAARKRAYSRKAGALLTALFCILFGVLLTIYEAMVGVSPYRYLLCGLAFSLALVLGYTTGERKAEIRFGNNNNKNNN